jgi:hypothetical protein
MIAGFQEQRYFYLGVLCLFRASIPPWFGRREGVLIQPAPLKQPTFPSKPMQNVSDLKHESSSGILPV